MIPQRKMTYQEIRGIGGDSSREQVRVPNVIALVGLPARGKTYISHKLCRYLNWIGIKTRAFNVGEYRRRACNLDEQGASDFFSPKNVQGSRIRDECAKLAMEDMGQYLEQKEGEVAIFDATNTTRERRRWLVDFCKREERNLKFRIFFIESVCDDLDIINSNIAEVKISSPDYKGRMTEDQAREDFVKRIENYKLQYEPMDEDLDDDLSFIKVINAGRSFYVHNVNGHVQSRVVYFLMNIHLLPRSIYLTRHGESEYNRIGRLGGDSPLSENGINYAQKLREYFESENIPCDLRIWSSQKIRAAQTANMLKDLAAHVEYWKVLDEIDAGICEGLTYEDFQARYPKQFSERDKDKYHYRYPSGESYEDLVARLEPVIMELERQSNVLVVSHQAVLRCILAYFDNKNRNELPYLNVPLHTVIKLTPKAYSCEIEMFKFRIDAVDTYRAKPNEPAKSTSVIPFELSIEEVNTNNNNEEDDASLINEKISNNTTTITSNINDVPLDKNINNISNHVATNPSEKAPTVISLSKVPTIDEPSNGELTPLVINGDIFVAAVSATASQVLNSHGVLDEYHAPRLVVKESTSPTSPQQKDSILNNSDI